MAWLCRQLGVALSGFYAWRQRQQNPGRRARENAVLSDQVQAVFERYRGFYGAPRIHQELRAADHKVRRHRVARLMRNAALKAQTRGRFRTCQNMGNRAAAWPRTCCSKSSAQPILTAAGPVTSPTSAPPRAGGPWPFGSTCTAAA